MESLLTQITNYLWTQSWQIAVLVVIIAAASLALKSNSAHVRYLLWLIVLAKCLVPPLLTIPLAVLPQEKPSLIFETIDTSSLEHGALSLTKPSTANLSALNEKPGSMTFRKCSGYVWFLCAAAFVFAAATKALRTNLWLKRQRKPLADDKRAGILELLVNMEISFVPKVWLVNGIGQPFVWGLLRGSIYLPDDFFKIDSDEHYKKVLCHELSHILRFDAAVNIFQIIVQAIFWFHPFVWLTNKKIRSEREKCCDEMAIALLDAKAKDYSAAIVNTLIAEQETTRPVPTLAVSGPAKNIEERIKTIMKPGKKFYKRPNSGAVIMLLLTALLTIPTGCALTRRKTLTDLEAKSTGSLHQAVANGDIELVKSLIEKGVDINVRDKEGRTALELAKDKEHEDIVVLLRMHEAKEDIIKIDVRLLLGPSDAREFGDFVEREKLESSQVPGYPSSRSFLLNTGQIKQFWELFRLTSEYKVLMSPTLEVVDGGTASIRSSARYDYISGYREPNQPSEEPNPIKDSVDTGDNFQVKPKIQHDGKDIMVVSLDFEISNIIGHEKYMYKGKYPYEIPIIEKIALATHYKVTAGQTLLLSGLKITDRTDRTKKNELLVLITTQKL